MGRSLILLFDRMWVVLKLTDGVILLSTEYQHISNAYEKVINIIIRKNQVCGNKIFSRIVKATSWKYHFVVEICIDSRYYVFIYFP